jgi:hypothetical protein
MDRRIQGCRRFWGSLRMLAMQTGDDYPGKDFPKEQYRDDWRYLLLYW